MSLAQEEAGVAKQREDGNLPRLLYGMELSYFTGKLEGVLRYKELPYTRVLKGPIGEVEESTGTAQVPALQIADGRWMTDSTPIIAWLDEKFPETPVMPGDPVTRFFSLLLEDYADEWLWRPAMHYRWDYAESAAHQGRVLAEADDTSGMPDFLKRYFIINRQRKLFTVGDGVTSQTWEHVESIFHDSLSQFTNILASRPYLLGERPSIADFGFFGPMFRHFAMDPVSARIMRETAPAVFEWVARTWNARYSTCHGPLLGSVPADWGPILDSVGTGYLPYLCANADAWKSAQANFDVTIEGAPYRNIRTSFYRVWCLEELRRHYDELPEDRKSEARGILEAHGCWQGLWQVTLPPSPAAENAKLPFAGVGTQTGLTSEQANKTLNLLPVRVPNTKATHN